MEKKEQKDKLLKELEMKQYNLIRQKDVLLKQFKILQKNKELNTEVIQNIFPEDQELIDEIEKLREWQKEEEKRQKLDNYKNETISFNVNYSQNFMRNNINKSKTFITEDN